MVLHSLKLQTKAQDCEVGDVTCLFFHSSSGALAASVSAVGPSATVRVPSEVELECRLFANVPGDELNAVHCISDLDMAVSRLRDFNPHKPPLVSSISGTFSTDSVVVAGMRRLQCKVRLEQLTPSFVENGFRESEIIFEKVMLCNVCPSVSLSGRPLRIEPLLGGMEAGIDPDVAPLLVSEPQLRIEDAVGIRVGIELYCCPNPRAEETLLALSLLIDGERNWYAVPLPAMECNNCFVLRNLVLCGPGAPSPTDPLARRMVDFSVTMLGWEQLEVPADF